MFIFILGFLTGVACVLFIAYLILFNVFGEVRSLPPSIEQFQPLKIPEELKLFLKSGPDGGSQWESCFALSLLLHFLYQEHKDTRQFKRWVHKRLQLELNDLTTRSAAGRLIQSIQMRDLSFGNQFPIVNNIRVEKCKMSEDEDFFEEIAFIVDMDYNGGFQTSVDVALVLGRIAQLSLLRLSGKVRITLTRLPYAHWSAAFIDMPQLDFKVESQFEGRQLKTLIPLIEQQFRKILQRKHVWPNYKIRYRPLFPHPLLQPSSPLAAFEHIKMSGAGIEVTVLQCTRLNVSLAKAEQTEVYCTVSLDHKPFIHNPQAGSSHSISVLLTFTRHSQLEPLGLVFNKTVSELGFRAVKISEVEPESIAERCGFNFGDILVAVNNVPIRNERQAHRLLSGTVGDLLVLVERNLNEYDLDESEAEDVIITSGIDNSEEFVCLGEKNGRNNGINDDDTTIKRSNSASILPAINKSISIPLSSSLTNNNPYIDLLDSNMSRSLESSFLAQASLDDTLSVPDVKPKRKISANSKRKDFSSDTRIPVVRVESARVPKVSISPPINDLRRSRSESEVFMMDDENDNDISISAFKDSQNETLLPDTPVEDFLAISKESDTSEGNQDKITIPESSSPKPYSKRARLHARASEMASKFSAGRAKMNEYLWSRRHAKDDSPVELAMEAEHTTDISDEEIYNDTVATSPADETKVHPSAEVLVVDKGKKRRIPSFRKKKPDLKLDDQVSRKSKESLKDSPDSPPAILSRSTKSVPLAPDVLWGQSLHYQLEKKSTRYLNVTVHARTPLISQDMMNSISIQDLENRKPVLLGSTSIYIPQIIDDCQLLLSNCHREVFPLRPPNTSDSLNRSDLLELSHHAGFDARLCFGDITLGFRFFPNGLPESILMKNDDDFISRENISDGLTKSKSSTSVNTLGTEKTKLITGNEGYAHCGLCKGKIWLKSATRCSICHFVCHIKCTDKVNNQIACQPHADDDKFENELQTEPSFIEDTLPVVQILSSEATENSEYLSTTSHTSRRRMIANKVHEKISSTWKNVGASRTAKKSIQSEIEEKQKMSEHDLALPKKEKRIIYVKDILPDNFLKSLKGSPRLIELNFEPGNAYNESVISKAKNLGKNVFDEIIDIRSRKLMINDQIDFIQTKINETTSVRRNVAVKSGDDFENIDNRLQALALLMLHYCSGLQDCVDKEDEEEFKRQQIIAAI